MICVANQLSLIFVPLLTIMFILGLVLLLWPKSGKNKAFLLCKKIISASAIMCLDKIDLKFLKKLKKSLKAAINACDSLAGDEFYELDRVLVRINECYSIISSIILTDLAEELPDFKLRIKNDIDEAIVILQDLGLIPDDLTKHEGDLLKIAKEIFSVKYKTDQAIKYLKSIKQEEKNMSERF